MQLESLLQYLDAYLGVSEHPDYAAALNGLQVGGPAEVARIVAAVDASEASVAAAVERGADLLLVHHGLFWEGLKPLTGRRLRRVRPLIEHGVGLYSVHLPLDGHAEVGNAALLARALDLRVEGPFGEYKGATIGWWGALDTALDAPGLAARFENALGGGPVRIIPGGPERITRVGVVTGGGASFVESAVDLELDALVTGEGSHHSYFDAMELGVHLLFGGHYATETFGVKALAAHLAERFDLEWEFVDQPTGL
jgi:dinuclear metal center YbgI/SA1388 family protein